MKQLEGWAETPPQPAFTQVAEEAVGGLAVSTLMPERGARHVQYIILYIQYVNVHAFVTREPHV